MIETTPNFYTPDTLYSFTLNSEDKHQHFNAGSKRLEKCHAYYYSKLLEGLNQYAHYVAYMELSEPRDDKPPRAHIHGTFAFKGKKSVRDFLTYGKIQLAKECNLDIDTVTHASKWASYIIKQQDILRTKPFTNNDKMIVQITGDSDDEEGEDFLEPTTGAKRTQLVKADLKGDKKPFIPQPAGLRVCKAFPKSRQQKLGD